MTRVDIVRGDGYLEPYGKFHPNAGESFHDQFCDNTDDISNYAAAGSFFVDYDTDVPDPAMWDSPNRRLHGVTMNDPTDLFTGSLSSTWSTTFGDFELGCDESLTTTVSFDASGLDAGTYKAALVIPALTTQVDFGECEYDPTKQKSRGVSKNCGSERTRAPNPIQSNLPVLNYVLLEVTVPGPAVDLLPESVVKVNNVALSSSNTINVGRTSG